ncbi:hypothetical protein F7725_022214 [Dissostichus mawsoni]|uniref:HAT C-terminal dimerisation domain-containing protein n=1 Tax=Dissostichus mawsoni TaxID=36200 RepID=A0A7J5YZD6_DISMA|nr:hypothetical protein F7725_022214 [Dissostichus mawsoni]
MASQAALLKQKEQPGPTCALSSLPTPTLAALVSLCTREWRSAPHQNLLRPSIAKRSEIVNTITACIGQRFSTFSTDPVLLASEVFDPVNMPAEDIISAIQQMLTEKESKYPNLLHLVRIVLVFPVSTSQVEHQFSTKKRMQGDWRLRLKTSTIEDLLLIKSQAYDPVAYESRRRGGKMYFRMSKDHFDELLGKVGPLITKADTSMRLSIGPAERLAICLRLRMEGKRLLKNNSSSSSTNTTTGGVVEDEVGWRQVLPGDIAGRLTNVVERAPVSLCRRIRLHENWVPLQASPHSRAVDDSVGVEHGDDLEDEGLPQTLGHRVTAAQKLQGALHHPAGIGLSWVDTAC